MTHAPDPTARPLPPGREPTIWGMAHAFGRHGFLQDFVLR